MKKLLFLSFLVCSALISNAQSLSVTFNDNPVNSDDTLTVVATEDELQFRPAIENTSMEDIVTQVVVEKLNETSISVTAVCADVCISGNASNPFTIPAQSNYSYLYIDFEIPAGATTGFFKVNVNDINSDANNVSFYVYVENGQVSVVDVENAGELRIYPNPASGMATVEYANADANSQLVVFDMSGKAVRTLPLGSEQGTASIDVSSLPAGVYHYAVSGSNGLSTMKKLVVK